MSVFFLIDGYSKGREYINRNFKVSWSFFKRDEADYLYFLNKKEKYTLLMSLA